ncbi:MAG TPA: dihydroxy-acid dehydratase [Deltaproteobacteria bacterium]|jgi:dihydroxy-acid dehydratase|nr:dihydroxy-acid dehydratase [Candidatus Lambdaproteobacteria bacterium]HIL15073.1 dihydroxy-acid dehydratase [Deltaproteobacteria bacterium]|tara:strand:- start:159 stop:1892 length:1734 start_codon:yes stop_codon:yes gene_type:complete
MKKPRKTPESLRSLRWYGPDDLRSFGHRSRTKQMGLHRDEFVGKPVIGIINPWNEMNTCHTHFPQRVQDVKRGIYQVGGFPVELPAMSLGEQLMKPTAMMYRNFLAMEVEELLRSYPIDGAVLMGGCDKTTPGVLMGAISMNLPCIYVPGGAMLRGHWRGKTLGSGTDVWKYWDDRRSGKLDEKSWFEIEDGIARSPGTCMTMGTAATMMSIAEALGMSLPGASSIPAVDSNHNRMASLSGQRVVDLVWEDVKPTDILTEQAFENAIMVLMAIGGSTNGIIHLTALARRVGVGLDLESFDRISQGIPLLANIKPSGSYVMEDFYYAGGLRALMQQLKERLHLEALTINGRTVRENLDGAEVFNPDVIRLFDNPVKQAGGTAVLHGSLAPNGAVIKPTAAEERLWKHRGPALVFKDIRDLKARVDSEDLDVTADSVLVLQHAGPIGAPGMPEWGQLPVPKKLLDQGIRDIVRISDARMSGTSYGACILHVAPEAALGGPLALVRDGDLIELDVEGRRLDLLVPEAELEERRTQWQPPKAKAHRGYAALYTQHVNQAHEGCDFDFLLGTPGETPEPDIF